MSFVFYAEPVEFATAASGDIKAHVGLGSDGDDESVLLHVGDGYRHDADILLNRDDVNLLIAVLTDCRQAMDDEESA